MPPPNSRQKKKSASAGSLALPRVHRVADADPPGSSLIALGRMHPSAEASGSTSLSRCRWASGGFRHRPNRRPKPCATGLELFNSTSRECPKTLRLPPPPCVGFGTWIAPSGWAARGSRGIRSVSSPFGFQRPLRESLVGWASCHASKDDPIGFHPDGWASCHAPKDDPFSFHPGGWASCSAPKSKPFDGHPAAAPLRVDHKKLLSETRPEALPKPFFVSPANLSKFLCCQIGLVR